jgi:hypothetical protein
METQAIGKVAGVDESAGRRSRIPDVKANIRKLQLRVPESAVEWQNGAYLSISHGGAACITLAVPFDGFCHVGVSTAFHINVAISL